MSGISLLIRWSMKSHWLKIWLIYLQGILTQLKNQWSKAIAQWQLKILFLKTIESEHMNNLYKENQECLSAKSLFKWEPMKMIRYTINVKKKDWIDKKNNKEKESKERNNLRKGKLKYGRKNLLSQQRNNISSPITSSLNNNNQGLQRIRV